MPTHDETNEFWRDWGKLTTEQQRLFKAAVAEFQHDLSVGIFRPSLRVKGYRGSTNVFEMTWAPNGRALWRYGAPLHENERHVVWLRIGTHEIFRH